MPITSDHLKPYTQTWEEKQLRHLLRRTLFGSTRSDLLFFKGKTMSECVEILLQTTPLPPAPVIDKEDKVFEHGSFVFAPESKDEVEERLRILKMWWAGLILNSGQNIGEKMVLFWHNHFVVEFNTVMDSRYSYRYLNILRQNATGNFKKMLKEITVDPCMLVYLNGNLNDKKAPNENYGRELQELFAVGKGHDSHYTESDVKAAARVLSGWKDDKTKIGSYFDPASHNTDDKQFSAFYNNHKIGGRSGSDGARETDELIDMICSNKEVPKFLCRKLYRWFVNSTIDEKVETEVIAPLAEVMIQSNYEIKPVLKALFSSSFFYDPFLTGGLIKSPVDYMIGLVREFNMTFPDKESRNQAWFSLNIVFEMMGQNIGNPPTVAGWPAYYEFPFYDKNWITSEGLALRNKVVRFLSHPEETANALDFDFIGLAGSLSKPSDANALVSESLAIFCTVQPGSSQLAYLQKLLEGKPGTEKNWSAVWSEYKADPTNEAGKKEVFSRLRNLYDNIFLSPEFQIM